MAPQTDLSKAGFEGFGMVENLRKASTAPQYHQQQVQHPHHNHYRQLQTPPQTNFVEVIDCYEAVRKYGGVLEVEKLHYKQAPQPRINSYEAAQMYDGVLFVDNNLIRKKQHMLRKPYY